MKNAKSDPNTTIHVIVQEFAISPEYKRKANSMQANKKNAAKTMPAPQRCCHMFADKKYKKCVLLFFFKKIVIAKFRRAYLQPHTVMQKV